MKRLNTNRLCLMFITLTVLFENAAASAQTTEQLAAAILRGHTLFYKTTKTLSEVVLIEYTYRGRSQNMDLSQRNTTSAMHFVFIRGKGFCLEANDTAIYVYGDSLTVYRPMQAQYQVFGISKDLSLKELLANLDPCFQAIRWDPTIIGILGKGDTLQTLVPEITKLEAIKRDKLGPRDVWHVHACVGSDDAKSTQMPLEMWFDVTTCQLLKAELDFSSVIRTHAAKHPTSEESGASTPIEAKVSYSVTKSIRNGEIEESQLRFKAAEDDRKVDRFEFFGLALLNKEAPQIEAKTLSGERFSIKSQRGKVILLDFWSTWCGSCITHLPYLQKLSDAFGEDLIIVGVNADNPDQLGQVQQVLGDNKISFRQITDTQGTIRRSFRVGAFPCLVLIDREGVIRDMFPAQSPLSSLRNCIEKHVAKEK
jgi:cytochrome c biogenesis protein CcmG, thiol:disulfide interchange protein DsbE